MYDSVEKEEIFPKNKNILNLSICIIISISVEYLIVFYLL